MAFGAPQHPPPGLFSSDEVAWTTARRWGKTVEEAVIGSDRLEDFLAGERVRGLCALTKASSAAAANTTRAGSLGHKQYYQCSHGPEDYSQPSGQVPDLSNKPLRGPGSRPNSKRVTGASQKRGCKCSYMAAQVMSDPGLTLLRMYVREHRNHGAASPEGAPGLAALTPRVSDDAKGWMHGRLPSRSDRRWGSPGWHLVGSATPQTVEGAAAAERHHRSPACTTVAAAQERSRQQRASAQVSRRAGRQQHAPRCRRRPARRATGCSG